MQSMTAFRSPRLEQIFGAPLDAVTYEQVLSLIPEIAESDDLEFKQTLYADSDSGRKDCATDITAMSNARGGLIVQGIGEVEGRAGSAPGVPLLDNEIGRIRSIVANRVQPLPDFDIIPVRSPHDPHHGFLLLGVPQSIRRPHCIYKEGSCRFPRRHGTTTRFLSPTEIAEEYRAQFAGLQGRADEAAHLEQDFVTRLDRSQTFLVVSLVPDRPGSSAIDQRSFREFERDALTTNPYLFFRARSFQRASLRSRRLTASGPGTNPVVHSKLGCELYDDGRGVFATILDPRTPRQGEPRPEHSSIDDEAVVHAIASGMHFLARHARDRTATAGLATVRVTISPVRGDLPAMLMQGRTAFIEQVGRRLAEEPPTAEAVADISDLARANPELLSVTYRLSSNIFQEFGHAEAAQLTVDGAVRIRYWDGQTQKFIRDWAAEHGVTISEDELPY